MVQSPTGVTVSVGAMPACVTVMLRVTWGLPNVVTTVTVAVRGFRDVFAVASIMKPPPHTLVMESQPALLVADHVVLDVTTTYWLLMGEPGLHVLRSNMSVGDGGVAAACVTEMVRSTGGLPVWVLTVILAERV